MMRNNRLTQHVAVFFVLCLTGAVLAIVGLRLYYYGERLDKALKREYNAADIQVFAGEAKIEGTSLVINSVKPDGVSFINVGQLHIDSRFYERIVIEFANKSFQQGMLLAAREKGKEFPVERVVLPSREQISVFTLDELLPEGAVLGDVGLLTDRVASPYRIQSIKLEPKKLSNKGFLLLLWDCFAINKQWENWSINTHRSPHPVFIPPKMLVLIWFVLVGMMFAIYLRIVKVPIINAWWATIVAAWMTLDIHYLVEKTVITKNVYDTYAHLSDDEKDLATSPEPAKLAQMIKSVLPDDGKPKRIRIQSGWKERSLKAEHSDKRYLSGKLQYYLLPNSVYMLGKKIPRKVWIQGGFYYVDMRDQEYRLEFDDKSHSLVVKIKQEFTVQAELLLDREEMTIYRIVGGRKMTTKKGD